MIKADLLGHNTEAMGWFQDPPRARMLEKLYYRDRKQSRVVPDDTQPSAELDGPAWITRFARCAHAFLSTIASVLEADFGRWSLEPVTPTELAGGLPSVQKREERSSNV